MLSSKTLSVQNDVQNIDTPCSVATEQHWHATWSATGSSTGLTQAQLAERIGTSHSAISRIESGQHTATPETLRKLAAALDMRLVIGFEHGPKKNPERDLIVFG